MNSTSLLVAVLATAFAGPTFATSKSPADLQQEAQLRPTFTLTRAQVRADVAAAMARGERLSQGDSNRNSPSVHRRRGDREPSAVASRDAAAVK